MFEQKAHGLQWSVSIGVASVMDLASFSADLLCLLVVQMLASDQLL